jgi:flagellar protein FlgJ
MPDPIALKTPVLQTLHLRHRIESATRSITAASQNAASEPDPKLKSACQEMESIFIHYLIKEMRATIEKSGFINESRAEQIYTSMLDAETAKEAAARGGIGYAKLLLDQLSMQAQKEDASPE